MAVETLGFETEVKQLLNLMVHSLYSNKEIFIRELISNSSDALDKLRHKAITDPELMKNGELAIRITTDKDAKTLTISDNGIGMSRQEVIENLGTIARSGTQQFLASMSGDEKKDAALIGQFGVGFYSGFIVADKITVKTRGAGLTADQAVSWTSTGEGEYTIEDINKDTMGTDVILHLKEAELEFVEDFRIRNIVNKYSDHINFPVEMLKMEMPSESEEEEKEPKQPEYEAVNSAKALWTLPKQKISDDEYNEFYKHISHDFENPLHWAHNHVEGKLEYTSLLYVPGRAPFDLWNREQPRGLKLYVQRVFIMDNAEQFLPLYLRFIKGVVDTKDLSLNISREILQNDSNVESMRSALTKRVLNMLDKLAKSDAEKYATFWEQFGEVLKEGPAEDHANKEQVANLLRFSTTHTDNEKADVSLKEYIDRMSDKQDKIYYVTAETFAAAKNSPHLEIFRKKGIEVILLHHRIDEWLVAHLTEFGGKTLQSVAKGDLDIAGLDSEEDKEQQEQQSKDFASVIEQVQQVLENKVKEVRLTHRLTDSPACVVMDDNELGGQMQKMLKAAGQDIPTMKPILELNPDHNFIKNLQNETDDERFAEWALVLLEQSILAEGGQLDDPASFVKRFNDLMLRA